MWQRAWRWAWLGAWLAGCAGGAQEASTPDRAWEAPAPGTARDPSTKLTWTRCAPGQAMLDPDCAGEALTFWAEEAEILCVRLSLAGLAWRVPTAEELGTLIVCPGGEAPDPTQGCAGPTGGVAHNPAWFPHEGATPYWTSEIVGPDRRRVRSLATGAAGEASGIADRLPVRCVSEGGPFRAPAELPIPDPALVNLRIVRAGRLPVWSEASISAPALGSLAAGQIVRAGAPGPEVRWRGGLTRFVRISGHPLTGWTLESLLDPMPEQGVLEAIQAAPAAISAPSPDDPPRERLAPGEQYYALGPGAPGQVRIALRSSPAPRIGEAPAEAFRWVDPSEFVCKRRQDALAGMPASLIAWWPRDPQGCERFEATREPPPFPKAREAWRLHGPEGGFNGWIVDGIAVGMDSRPLTHLRDNLYAVLAPGTLRIYRLHPLAATLLLERVSPERPAPTWTLTPDGRLTSSDGNICRAEGQTYVCLR